MNVYNSPSLALPQNLSLSKCCNNPIKLALVVSGALIALAGFFVLMAAAKILPSGVNAISEWGMGGYGIGISCLAVGVATILASFLVKQATESERNFESNTRETSQGLEGIDGFETNDEPIDFSKITPQNIAQYFDVHQTLSFTDAKFGDFLIQSGEDGISAHIFYNPKDNDGDEFDKMAVIGAEFCMAVHEGKFAKHTGYFYKTFSNLKENLNYLFAGNYRHGTPIAKLPYVRLKMVNGGYYFYKNPYLK